MTRGRRRRLYFSHRRMLDRLSFDWRQLWELIDADTGQMPLAAEQVLLNLEAAGLAQRRQPTYGHDTQRAWRITDAGVMAAMAKSWSGVG